MIATVTLFFVVTRPSRKIIIVENDIKYIILVLEMGIYQFQDLVKLCEMVLQASLKNFFLARALLFPTKM